MQIGILTYHAVCNFGANLQALSTYRYLLNAGHQPIIIDFYPKSLEEAFNKTIPPEQLLCHKSFVQKYFNMTKRCRNAQDIVSEIESNDIEYIIIGSDAVIQHFPLLSRIRIYPSRKKLIKVRIEPVRYETNFPNPFWGEFLEHTNKRIRVGMMSVSCQDTDFHLIPKEKTKIIKLLINKMSYISVRDKRTQELFKYISHNSIIPDITPDPVFAFNDNVLNTPVKVEILNKFKLPEKYILLSFDSLKTVTKQWINSFRVRAEEKGYHCVAFPMPGKLLYDDILQNKIDLPLDPLDWYSLIKFSSGYVGEKMHPIIVSLHNNVPFFSFDSYGLPRLNLFRNNHTSKIYQLLDSSDFKDCRNPKKSIFNFNPKSPEYVLDKICSFNLFRCQEFSSTMRIRYQEMMNELLINLEGKLS